MHEQTYENRQKRFNRSKQVTEQEKKISVPSVPSCSLLFKSDPGGVVELDFDKSVTDGVNIYAKCDGDAEIGLFSDEVAVNFAP
jgi:hypothetical protein